MCLCPYWQGRDLSIWGHFLIVLNLRNPNLRSACAKERGNAHYWPFYVLCCFSAPSGPIWACEDTFWEYSISRIQIWDRLAQKYVAMRTMTHFMAQSVFLVFWVQSRQFLSPFPSLPFPFQLDLVIIVISSICFTIGFMRCCPSQVFKSILHKLGIYYRYGQESISISDIVPLVVLDLNSSERLWNSYFMTTDNISFLTKFWFSWSTYFI